MEIAKWMFLTVFWGVIGIGLVIKHAFKALFKTIEDNKKGKGDVDGNQEGHESKSEESGEAGK
jgi:hypothetical protein